MKKIFFVLIAALTCLSSCYDLDRMPQDKLSSETFWKTESQCKQGVMGVYAALKNNDLFGKMFMIDVNSDIAVGYDQYEALQLGTCTPLTSFLNGKWQNGYDGIQRANVAIHNIMAAEIDETAKNQMLGELYFLRGLMYSHLLNYFGGVPIYDESINLEQDFNNLLNPRSSKEDTYKFIIDDLERALTMGLPKEWDKSNYGRVTESAVNALLGKIYLYKKEYDKAIGYLEKSTEGHELYANYGDLFTLKGHDSSEMIFSIINLGGMGNNLGMPMAWFAGTRATFGSCWNNTLPSTGLADMYEYKDGRPFDWDELFPGYTTDNSVKEKVFCCDFNDAGTELLKEPEEAATIKEMYQQRDPRMMATVIAPYTHYLGWVRGENKDLTFLLARNPEGNQISLLEGNGYMRNNRGGWETYFWRKFVPEGNMDGALTNRAHTPINFPIIRLADVYLMLAECYNETGNQEKAVEFINKVRARVGMALINSGAEYLNASSKEEVFQRIFHERAVEFAGEGLRDSDLRRWNLSHKILNHDEFGITGKRLITRQFDEQRDYLWPIPSKEIEINNALEQNPYW